MNKNTNQKYDHTAQHTQGHSTCRFSLLRYPLNREPHENHQNCTKFMFCCSKNDQTSSIPEINSGKKQKHKRLDMTGVVASATLYSQLRLEETKIHGAKTRRKKLVPRAGKALLRGYWFPIMLRLAMNVPLKHHSEKIDFKEKHEPPFRVMYHGNLRGTPQCHPPRPRNKALLRDY